MVVIATPLVPEGLPADFTGSEPLQFSTAVAAVTRRSSTPAGADPKVLRFLGATARDGSHSRLHRLASESFHVCLSYSPSAPRDRRKDGNSSSYHPNVAMLPMSLPTHAEPAWYWCLAFVRHAGHKFSRTGTMSSGKKSRVIRRPHTRLSARANTKRWTQRVGVRAGIPFLAFVVVGYWGLSNVSRDVVRFVLWAIICLIPMRVRAVCRVQGGAG